MHISLKLVDQNCGSKVEIVIFSDLSVFIDSFTQTCYRFLMMQFETSIKLVICMYI